MTENKGIRKSRSDKVVAEMIEIIKSGEFELDSKLPSETVLSKRFGVSRSTLREAFKKLEQIGLVSIKHGSGTYINETAIDKIEQNKSNDDVNELIRKGFTLRDYQMTQYIDARMMVEFKALELAIDKMDDENYSRIFENIQESEREAITLEEYIEYDCQFHREIVKASKNEFLMHFWMILEPCLKEQQVRLIGTDYDIKGSIEKHKMIYEAMLQRNKKNAKAHMEEHIGLVLGRFFTNITKSTKNKQ